MSLAAQLYYRTNVLESQEGILVMGIIEEWQVKDSYDA
jgi:hypothetical protein